MQTLRKKTSPLKYKNETTRFLGDGVSFKAKLIGILEVSEARGDRMCQEALSDLKMAIRAAGEHKQRITINIAIDGLRLRDEKTGDSLYHHPVHKISFIAQDMTDSRAFGYIFGSPDTGHRFFGIKTDKAASQVVIAMRDLFQVVFALKKKEIELAKQHLDKSRYTNSPLFSDSSISSAKLQTISQETTTKSTTSESKAGASAEPKSGGTAVADLVDLELELSSLQQGLNQMERITPSDPFGSKDDPFGDSFISYTKPILPPPPASGRERASRTSETSSVFSPRTPHTAGSLDVTGADAGLLGGSDIRGKKDFSFSQDFSSSREEASSGDWFTPPASNSIFEEPPTVAEPTKDEKHELAKQEIMSQFDVFTELDPLGTGRSKPYIDKKHFFQELKNPPKKVLNDLVSRPQPQEPPQFNPPFNQTATTKVSGEFQVDPFGEDPFVTEDPFADSEFANQDPFETEFGDFKTMGKTLNNLDKLRSKTDNLPAMYQSNLSKSPKSSMFEKQMSMTGTSPRNVQFTKQNTFDVQFESKQESKLLQLHENPSLDMSSESECAPEPPPRPASTLMQIKPPPLPPKKQANDLSVKPPPRPPHTEDSHYDYMDNYETAPNSLEFIKNVDKSPPLPVPARKAKFDSDFSSVPERPKKQFNVQSSEEDYLTPISFPDHKVETKKSGGILLPPPQKSAKKQNVTQVTVASYLELKPSLTTSTADNLNSSLEGLDITLSQLTLSGLNELANKLNIPASQLSSMTLVQLTTYLSNFIKARNTSSSVVYTEANSNSEFPAFKADFAANFNNLNNSSAGPESYDRYAVFRELMKEEIKQTKIDTEPEELQEEKEKLGASLDSNINNINKPSAGEAETSQDKYAALREIVETELKSTGPEQKDDNKNETESDEIQEQNALNEITEGVEETNIINIENKFIVDEKEKPISPKYNLIEYNTPLDNKDIKATTPLKSPKSPVNRLNPLKSPVPVAITEIMQNSARLTSGSLSDVVSGSSPEIDNTASNSEMLGKKASDAAGESWAIFEPPVEIPKEKQTVPSEEGVSPWSSDSKEFGNGSPLEWGRPRSGSGGDRRAKRRGKRDQEGWWDTSAEPEVQYYPPNRRSTDSYDEEYYECYERPRRRKQTSYTHESQAAGGHSSSSRDVSPWEEEPSRRREQRPGWGRHPRQPSFEKGRDRRHTDSWDEEDDFEYEEEHVGRFHRHSREGDRERHSAGGREHDGDRWDEWSEDRRYGRRRRDGDRWCCPDREQGDHEKAPGRYGSGRRPNPDAPPGMRRDRKHDERYYSRESQESPWEDEYSNDADEGPPPSHYLTAKRNWKRPSSASEMDRKTGEIKSRHYLGTGGSDGERDRRYKSGRRSRSRDSQYSEPSHRHKPEVGPAPRNPHRTRQHSKPQFEGDFEASSKKPADIPKSDHSNKKSATLASRKKTKDSPKTEENVVSTFPRKSASRAKSLFENDFIQSGDSPITRVSAAKFSYENDFETSEIESPTVANKPLRGLRQQSLFEKSQLDPEFKEGYRQRSLKESKVSPRFHAKSKSLFEDDFSPSDKPEPLPEDNSISSIKEEIDPNEEEDSFSTNNFEHATNSRKKKLNKHRLSNSDINIKKSESVNIFARENDPFDDDFFSESVNGAYGGPRAKGSNGSPRTTDLKWTDDFEDFDIEERK